ncbi:MAG TPA: gamma-glutamylcyclotransferase family protein [Burkholderiales bacterium]|nr:gamma-glutamylcyclotransferase family protein [Burkholderiales bacterium]
MTTQLGNRRVDAFFYGLFMDESVLRKSGVTPSNPRRASVTDFALRIGQRATLVPSKGAKAFGMLMSLTHADLDVLYGGPGLEHYKPEAVVARTLEGLPLPALCFNLPEAPNPEERNPEYAARLQSVLNQLGFPREYVESLL